jgi:hypothetical protein
MEEVRSAISAASPVLRVIESNSAQAIRFDDRQKTDLIDVLEAMLKSARRGDLKGLVYVARMRNEEQHAAAVGNYIADPMRGLIKAVECLVHLQEQREKR